MKKIPSYIAIFCLIIASVLIVPSCSTNSTKSIKTTLKGEVIDRPETTHLMLFKESEGFGTNWTEIPIVNGKFEYVLNSEHKEMYIIAFNEEFEQGYMRAVHFFSEPGVVEFTLFPMNRFRENKVKGGELTKKFWNYWNTILDKSEKIDNDLLQYLEDNYGEIIEKQELPEEYAELADQPWWQDLYGKVQLLEFAGIDVRAFIDSIRDNGYEQLFHWQFQYIKDNPTLVGYSILVSRAGSIISMNEVIEEGYSSARLEDISPYVELYQTVFAPKFPNHPYTEKMEMLLASMAIKQEFF